MDPSQFPQGGMGAEGKGDVISLHSRQEQGEHKSRHPGPDRRASPPSDRGGYWEPRKDYENRASILFL